VSEWRSEVPVARQRTLRGSIDARRLARSIERRWPKTSTPYFDESTASPTNALRIARLVYPLGHAMPRDHRSVQDQLIAAGVGD
jgi:hypothetical protein